MNPTTLKRLADLDANLEKINLSVQISLVRAVASSDMTTTERQGGRGRGGGDAYKEDEVTREIK